MSRRTPGTDTKEQIVRFVKAYDGGDCFFVKPVTVEEKQIKLDGYGGSLAPFETLNSEFIRQLGFEADIGVHQVTASQCAAIRFLSRVGNQSGPTLHLDIDAANLGNEFALTGSVANVEGGNVDLLLVADDGIVHNLTVWLKPDGDRKSFKVSLRNDDGPAQPQLLFAVVSDAPLAALKSKGAADQVFANAMTEALKTRQTLKADAIYFKLEK